jgi:hypothetical protein
MSGRFDRSTGRSQKVALRVVGQGGLNRVTYERATAAGTGEGVDLLDKVISELNV